MQRATMRLRSIGVGLAGVAVAAACHYYYKTPPPQHFYTSVDSIPFDSIRSYASGLKFNPRLYAADVRRVKFDSSGKSKVDPLGDSARIEPELGAWALDSTELAQGRIIARIMTDSVHAPPGYSHRWTWWWVDKRGGAWRSLLLSDSLMTRRSDSLIFHTDTGYRWRQSIARWGSQWSTCTASACCTKQ